MTNGRTLEMGDALATHQLDEARGAEAIRLTGNYASHPMRSATTIAARLAREGWTPPDPLEAEIAKLSKIYVNDSNRTAFNDILRKALQRGIEIGRAQR